MGNWMTITLTIDENGEVSALPQWLPVPTENGGQIWVTINTVRYLYLHWHIFYYCFLLARESKCGHELTGTSLWRFHYPVHDPEACHWPKPFASSHLHQPTRLDQKLRNLHWQKCVDPASSEKGTSGYHRKGLSIWLYGSSRTTAFSKTTYRERLTGPLSVAAIYLCSFVL